MNAVKQGAFLLGLVVCAGRLSALDGEEDLARLLGNAETSLRAGRMDMAARHYAAALVEGWLLSGKLAVAAGRHEAAKEAFAAAAALAPEDRRPRSGLAVAHVQASETAEAVALLRTLAEQDPKDLVTRRLLVQALVADGKPDRAVVELEAVRAADPEDVEVVFALAGGYLRLKQADTADRLFREVVAARPLPQTHVLVARTYMDHGEYDRAREALRAALAADPRTPHAHYYLGLAAANESGVAAAETAAKAFEAELASSPGHLPSILQLGMALVEARRPAEALPHLEIATATDPPAARALYYLARAQLGLDRVAAGADTLRRALARAEAEKATPEQLGILHNHLGQACRKLGDSAQAASHFAQAERLSALGTDASRERLARYLSDESDADVAGKTARALLDTWGLAGLDAGRRAQLETTVRSALARSYLNLGVIRAQAEDFEGAAERFHEAARVDPGFPQVQYSLAVARFNARQFEQAIPPLQRALGDDPADAELRRMLALSWLNTKAYDKAAPLLERDPDRDSDPSLQYAYGLALVRSGRTADAQSVFARLVARHGDSAEVNVVMGQANAQQGDYAAAERLLRRALEQNPQIPEAHGSLGVLYLTQGKLAEAEAELRAELRWHPEDVASQQNLAVVLEAQQRPDDAAVVLRRVIAARPEFADARYLLGKILVTQGAPAEALEHLEVASRLSPDDAPIRYQLGRAYQQLGRAADSQREFELFRTLKSKR